MARLAVAVLLGVVALSMAFPDGLNLISQLVVSGLHSADSL